MSHRGVEILVPPHLPAYTRLRLRTLHFESELGAAVVAVGASVSGASVSGASVSGVSVSGASVSVEGASVSVAGASVVSSASLLASSAALLVASASVLDSVDAAVGAIVVVVVVDVALPLPPLSGTQSSIVNHTNGTHVG